MSIQLFIVQWCESFPKDKGGFSKEIHLPLEYKHTSTSSLTYSISRIPRQLFFPNDTSLYFDF